MSEHILNQFRREAKARGLSWAAVQAAYGEVKLAEREKRERPNEVRQAAWCMATTPGCWSFWRHGFCARWGRRVERHDYTAVPGYDLIGQELASWFPEYADDDGTERLFEFLFSPYDRMPTREELYCKAIDLAEYWAGQVQNESPNASEELEF